MNNTRYLDKFYEVPPEAKTPITGGRLNGKTDINPMWRIKALTELFGPVGIGWYYDITDKTLREGANGEIACFVDINLFYKEGEDWSKPVPGTGGSMYISKEKNGLYTDDDCFKKALTDAISVAAKAIGIGGKVYFEKDPTKYTGKGNGKDENQSKKPHDPDDFTAALDAIKDLENMWAKKNLPAEKLAPTFKARYGVSLSDATSVQIRKAIKDMENAQKKQEAK